MHVDQVDVTVDVVRRLVADQFPRWRELPVHPVASDGTVNALFRLGDEVVLRFPLRPGPEARAELVREQENARLVAAHVPLEVPTPIALGEPGDGYPGAWAAYRWIPGAPVTSAPVRDLDALARDLAGFVRALHAVPTGGRRWDGSGRGGPLGGLDGDVRAALAASARLTDTVRLGELWSRCLAAAPHPGPDVWIHADLMPGNLLVRDGRLAAVIDLAAVGVGDPAVDLMPAWNLLPTRARETFRRDLDADDATWDRGRGWALAQAIIALPYYIETNPGMAQTARRTLAALLD
ncbi:MAG TPA: aminoglycoside phosphotransferase family protein [Streptosporangiales bacterium]